ncbi:MAG: efflux transporter outer membrane subunit [Magnetospirillum sp.]|nr:efflux transporter outer membrane subunit [Magnetospirillum sp.]
MHVGRGFWARASAWGRLSAAGAAIGGLALAACAAFDDGKRDIPRQPLPAAFKDADAAQASAAGGAAGKAPLEMPKPGSAWWKDFHNDEIDRLVAAALVNNHDLKVAVARIAQAEAQAGMANAAQYPNLALQGQYTEQAPAGGIATVQPGTPYENQRLPQIGLQTSYELDLWGKNAYAAQSALALAQASVHYREAVALTLTSDVVKTYIDYLAETDRLAVARRNLDDARKALAAVRTKMDRGDATIIDVQQQETAVANAEAAVPLHRLNRERAFNKLAALLGTTPSELSLSGHSLADVKQPAVAPGIPSELICRRPDIRRAEARLVAADADIKVARAKMYPDLSFSLQGGYGGPAFTNLIVPTNVFYIILGSLTQTIFDAGKVEDEIRFNKARREEMVESYRKAILDAVHDVEDALAELRSTGERHTALANAASHARQAYAVSTTSFDSGNTDYITLLDTERSLFTAEDAETGIRAERLKASVDLFKALGGGIEPPRC